MPAFVTHRRVEFVDTDMAGIVHFSRFPIFMETAEHQLREHLGYPVQTADEAGAPIGWPRVSVECEYKSPARFGDQLTIEVEVLALGRSSIRFGFRFRRGDVVLARGGMTSVCCRLAPEVRPVAIPPELVARLAPYRVDEVVEVR